MTRRERDPKVSVRMPESKLEAIDAVAEKFNVSRSTLLRRFTDLGLEMNIDAIGVEARIQEERQRIKDRARPVDQAGGFPYRVEEIVMERFKNGYAAKWLAAKTESLKQEAKVLERELQNHPDAPEIEEGELLDEVDNVLREALSALTLSDWEERYDNRFERLSGVREGKNEKEFALILLQNAMRKDRDLEQIGKSVGGLRIYGNGLPRLADEELPDDLSRDDVAAVARELRDQGLDPDDISTDPLEFNPWDGDRPAIPVDSHVEDGGGAVAVDGGDHEAIQAYSEEPKPVENGETPDDTQTTDMDQTPHDYDKEQSPTRDELLSFAVSKFREYGVNTKIERLIQSEFHGGSHGNEMYRWAIEARDLDEDAIIEDAKAAVESEGATEGTANV